MVRNNDNENAIKRLVERTIRYLTVIVTDLFCEAKTYIFHSKQHTFKRSLVVIKISSLLKWICYEPNN